MNKKIIRFLQTASLKVIMSIPIVLVMVILLIIISIHGNTENIKTFKLVLTSIMFLISGSAGIPMIIRKESFGFTGGDTDKAVIQGYTLLLSNWAIALIIVIIVFFT